jgi:hypothetical protein
MKRRACRGGRRRVRRRATIAGLELPFFLRADAR